jgi:hypothetical protein
MSSWGNNDNAANAPYWAVNSAICKSAAAAIVAAPTAANVAILYANTTQDAYITGKTVGLFNIDAQEIGAGNGAHGNGAHAGWNLKFTGTGGRAGRVKHETLICLAGVKGDGDGQLYANVLITLTGPSAAQVGASSTNANSVIFTVSPTLAGNTSATLTYQWQVNSNTGALGWTSVANSTPTNTSYVGGTSASLSVYPKTAAANAYVFRAVVTAADQGVTVTSSNAIITIVPGV